MLWNGNLEEFLDWFVTPKTTDEGKLRTALMSVPDESWGTVWARLNVVLHDEKSKYMPVAQNLIPGKPIEPWIPTEETMRNYDVTDKKEELLAAERSRRQQRRRS